MMHTRKLLTAAALCAMWAGSAAAETVSLTVWSDTARLEPFAAFDAAHGDIDLNVVTVAPPDLVAKIQLALRSGSEAPDVIFMAELTQIAQLSTRRSNYLMDLTGKVGSDILDAYLPNSNAPCTSDDGRLLCLRNDLAHMMLWTDNKRMAELGLEVPTTWEEFEALGETIAALDQGYMLGTGVEPFPVASMLTAGGCVMGFPVDGSPNTVRVDMKNDGCVRAAGMIDRMRANGSLSAHGPFEPAFVEQVQAGKLVLLLGPTWFGEHVLRPFYKVEEGRIAAAPPPRWSDEDQPLTWGWGGGVYGGWKDTEHPDEVVKLLTWMSNDVGLQGGATTMPASMAGSKAWGERVNADAYYAADNVYDVMLESADFTNVHYGGYRFDTTAILSKIDGATDRPLVDKLDDLQREIVNNAKVTDYEVVE